jgi:hypothetical protein
MKNFYPFPMGRLYLICGCQWGHPKDLVEIRSSHYLSLSLSRTTIQPRSRPGDKSITIALWAPDDDTAFLAAIACAAAFRYSHLLEIVALAAARIETFRAKAVS